MTDLSERLKNLTPEQQALLKLRLKRKNASAPESRRGDGGAGKPLAETGDGAPAAWKPRPPAGNKKRCMDFGLFFFSADGTGAGAEKYRLLLESAKFADQNGFGSVWTPERHFQAFGGLYPNPSVLSAALAVLTQRVQIRAGSVVLPLHSPVRVAEEWALVDNLSNGRVGLSFATGWHSHDYVIRPEAFENRRDLMFEGIETVRGLWAGETLTFSGVGGEPTRVRTLPRPVQAELPCWVTASSSRTWRHAGEVGANVLSILGASLEETANNIKSYRQARAENGYDPRTGIVSIMLHTFMDPDVEATKEKVRRPLSLYLKNFLNQFKEISEAGQFGDEESLLAFAFERYFNHASLLGSPQKCADMIETLCDIGVNDAACLIDFGMEFDAVMKSLEHLNALRAAYAPNPDP